MSVPLKIHASPGSHPSKAVYWACLIGGLTFELWPDPVELTTPEFGQLNPRRQMPTLVDDGFALCEMPAILGYLCDKHGWASLYPTDLATRARINQYLHSHHSTARLATAALMAPHVTVAFGGPGRGSTEVMVMDLIRRTMESDDPYAHGHQIVSVAVDLIEATGFPGESTYLCGTSAPSIADLACYEELAQLAWANLFEFDGFPKLSRWLEVMRDVPAHDAVHRFNMALGDIRTQPNTMQRMLPALEEGLAALTAFPGVTVIRSE